MTVASRLKVLQQEIKTLQDEEDALRAELLAQLKTQNVKSLRLEDGTIFTISHRETLKPKNIEKAFAWAQENNALTIDLKKAREILRHSIKTSSFFKIEKGNEFLIIKQEK